MRMLSLGPEENPGHQRCDACRWHLLAALATNGDTGTSRSHGSSLSVVRHHLISGARRVRKLELVDGHPRIGPRSRDRSSDRTRRLAYTGFLLSRSVMS